MYMEPDIKYALVIVLWQSKLFRFSDLIRLIKVSALTTCIKDIVINNRKPHQSV